MSGPRYAVGATVVVLAAGLAGCATHAPPSPSAASPDGQQAASSPPTPGAGSPTGQATGGPGAGGADPAHRLAAAARLTGAGSYRTTIDSRLTTADGQVSELHVSGAYRPGDQPAAELRRTGKDRAAPPELRLVGDTLYFRYGNVMRPGGGGKPWARVTVTTSSASLRRTWSAVERGMAASLMRMAATSHDVHRAGTGTVGGTATTHYAGAFHPADAIKAVPAADRRPLRELISFPTLRFDAWLDNAGHPRRFTVAGKDGARGYTLTQTFSSYGTPVHVTAPPSGQVQDGDGPVLPHPRR